MVSRKSTHTVRYGAARQLLIAARRDSGLTQAELAMALGKPQSYVSKVESGERRLDIVELIELLEALDCDPIRFVKALAAKA